MDHVHSDSSSQMTLQMLMHLSKHFKKQFRCNESDRSVFSADKIQNCNPNINKCKHDTKPSATSHQERICAVRIQNGAGKLHEDTESEDPCSPHSEHSYGSIDGYESGVTKERNHQQYLCRECQLLYKKARKIKRTVEETPKEQVYSDWRRKFWMMMNRVPSQQINERRKKRNRTLNSVVRKLKAKRQTGNLCLRCCRVHPFLKRNLRLCSMTQKLFHSHNSKQKRKRPTSSSKKSLQESSTKTKESLSCNLEQKNNKKIYSFVLDSSEEEDVTLNVKRYKNMGEDRERNHLQNHRDSIVEPVNLCQKQNTSGHAHIIHSPPTTHKKGMTTFNKRFHTNPPSRERKHLQNLIDTMVEPMNLFQEQNTSDHAHVIHSPPTTHKKGVTSNQNLHTNPPSREMRHLQNHRDSMVEPMNLFQEQNTSDHAHVIHSPPTTHKKGVTTFNKRFHTNPLSRERRHIQNHSDSIVEPMNLFQEQNTSDHAHLIHSPPTTHKKGVTTFNKRFHTNPLSRERRHLQNHRDTMVEPMNLCLEQNTSGHTHVVHSPPTTHKKGVTTSNRRLHTNPPSRGRKHLQNHRDSMVEPMSLCLEQNTSGHTHVVHSPPTTHRKGVTTFNQRFHTNPSSSDDSLGASPILFSQAQDGSFKELLQRMCLESSRSGIVREDRV